MSSFSGEGKKLPRDSQFSQNRYRKQGKPQQLIIPVWGRTKDFPERKGKLILRRGCDSSNGCWWSRKQQCGTDADSPAHCSAFWVNTNTANPRSWKILHQFPRVTNTRIQGTAALWLQIPYTTFIRASGTAPRDRGCRDDPARSSFYLALILRF